MIVDEKGKKLILVVEDDELVCQLMRLTLERKGYRVEVATNGMDGFDLALTLKPDLIITDVSMPIADGAHLVRRVRDTEQLRHTPIIVTTGYGTGSAAFVMGLGADGFEPKPIDPDGLLKTVRRLLKEN